MSSVNQSALTTKTTSVIIGSGAGGAVAFYELAKRESVLLLEEGSLSLIDVRNNSVADINRLLYRNAGLRLALGFPIVTIGEGKCIGGSTEINGGLFWRLPEHVKTDWKLLGFDDISNGALNEHFHFFEDLLGVRLEPLNKETDADSFLMHEAAKRLNWKSVPAPRLAPKCVKSNVCASGCPSLAKNSMSRTLIPEAQKNKGQLISEYAVKKLIPTDDGILIVPSNPRNRVILAQKCIVSCGAIESPRLLARSGILTKKIVKIGFHANFKVIARFNESVQARKGTIFTHQIQEFENCGFLIMPANLSKEYLATSSSHLDSSTYDSLQEQLDNLGLYTIQVRVKGRLLDFFPGSTKFNLLLNKFHRSDLSLIKESFEKASLLLFEAGAVEVIFPIKKLNKASNQYEAVKIISRIKLRHLSVTTVHIMSSLPISPNLTSVVDMHGFLRSDPRIQILDSSILPTTLGESPQGTIMALARYLLQISERRSKPDA